MKARVRVERRRVRRFVINRSAKAIWNRSESSRCVIHDISVAGARVVLEKAQALPERFTLTFTSDGKVARQCRVRWRSETDIGVTFEGAESIIVPPPGRDEVSVPLDC